MNKRRYIPIFTLILGLGLFLRLWHIEFGLPHSFYADEPEIAELAIKYTYEFRSIFANKDFYKLIPISFVYGTFPTYVFTLATMTFSKINGLLDQSFSKMDIYVFLRTLSALFSLILIFTSAKLAEKMTDKRIVGLITAFLVTLNWKFIVHSHYLNMDLYLTLLLSASFLSMYNYSRKESDTFYTVLSGILFGLAIGTKVTAGLTLPLYLFLFIKKKDYRGMVAFCFLALGAFAVTNPFSLIFADKFAYRIYEMFAKEGGMVFDSVNSNPFKYIRALARISTLPILVISLYGIFCKVKQSSEKTFDIFLAGNILFYLAFYSVQQRLVERWLLPILPIIFIYASVGVLELKTRVRKMTFVFLLLICAVCYLAFPSLLLLQFQRNTPKSQAYLWMQQNTQPTTTVLGYTEEGLDPLNKLPYSDIKQYRVYSSDGAQFFLPVDPKLYEYVIISSRPMENFKRKEVSEKYPFYTQKWLGFENSLNDTSNFELEKEFSLPKPNLIPLSDVFIYKNLNFVNPGL